MIAFEATRPSLFYQPDMFLLILAFFAIGFFSLVKIILEITANYKTEKSLE